MDIEHLTKHQIVLLTLLVSFVTSIATGIVTVSLMDQAPEGVTRVVNQIVEKTVEKVVPQTQGAATAAVTEKTVVIKDDDLAAQSIAAVQKGIIRIVEKGGDKLLARGIIITGGGEALTDRAALIASDANEFEAILSSGERVPLIVSTSTGTSTPIARVALLVGTTTGWAPAPLADSSKLVLGQSILRIGGVGSDTVGGGVIAMLPSFKTGDTRDIVAASVSSVTPGTVLITLFGEIIGLTTAASLKEGGEFYSIPALPSPTVHTSQAS